MNRLAQAGLFLFVPGKAKHASRQDSKGIRCSVVVAALAALQPRRTPCGCSGCRGRARV